MHSLREERLVRRFVFIPLLLLFLFFFWMQWAVPVLRYGWDAQVIYLTARATEGVWSTKPVTAYNYFWKRFEPAGDIVVKKGRPVVLRVTSSDVLHSFAIPSLPSFRRPIEIKAGEYQDFVFTPKESGKLLFLCWQVCSSHHSKMKGRILVE